MKSKIYKVIIALMLSCLFAIPRYTFAIDQIEMSAGIMNFDYAEYDDDGTFLDGEKGNMPGVAINFLGHSEGGFETEFGFDFYKATVDYDGHLQPSASETDPVVIANVFMVPFKTNTIETVTGLHAQISKALDAYPKLSLYGNFGYKFWNRAIQGKYISTLGNLGIPIVGFVPGATEKYQWYQLIFGGKYNVVLNDKSALDFSAGISRTLNPTMKTGAYTYKQKERTGYELGVDWLLKLSPGKRIGVGAELSYWEFGKSNIVGGYLEPYSESTMKKVHVIYQQDLNLH